jgi:hypothetical protein
MMPHERDRIADAIARLRPDWPAAQLRTLITEHLLDRPRRDVAVALAWIACEPNTSTPYRVLEAGPWWKAAGAEGSAQTRQPFDRGTFCAHCDLPASECRRRWLHDHEFESKHEYEKRLDAERRAKESA